MKVTEDGRMFVKTGQYWLDGQHYSYDRLVVTFENFDGPYRRPDAHREGWGAGYFRKRNLSHLCVKPAVCDWYQKPGLANGLRALKEQGFFARYGKVITYGASMGGFGALAYADCIGANAVIAFNRLRK